MPTCTGGVYVMRKPYSTPEVICQQMQLGVFGNYGDDGGGGNDDITPIKIIERFQMRMD